MLHERASWFCGLHTFACRGYVFHSEVRPSRTLVNKSAHFLKKMLHYLKRLAERSKEQRIPEVNRTTQAGFVLGLLFMCLSWASGRAKWGNKRSCNLRCPADITKGVETGF